MPIFLDTSVLYGLLCPDSESEKLKETVSRLRTAGFDLYATTTPLAEINRLRERYEWIEPNLRRLNSSWGITRARLTAVQWHCAAEAADLLHALFVGKGHDDLLRDDLLTVCEAGVTQFKYHALLTWRTPLSKLQDCGLSFFMGERELSGVDVFSPLKVLEKLGVIEKR